MTIEEMRKEMRREVVPEELVPQNIINRLIDEDAEPPKLDAFSFLTRLRALGIGSGDFLDLLEGCDAPAEVVEKIRENPAMNLQGLILTLENSELTTDDYTRILLTARQVWERTLTLRLEKSEKISQEVDISDNEDDEPVKVYGEELPETDVKSDEVSEKEAEEGIPEEAPDEEYDEDLLEMSFSAVLEKINAKVDNGEPENVQEENPENATEIKDGESASAEITGTEEKKKIVPKKPKKKRVAKPSAEATGNTDNKEDAPEIAAENAMENEEDGISFAEVYDQIKRDKKLFLENYENQINMEQPDEADGSENPRLGYHKGAIIGSTVGAAALIGAGFLIGNLAGNMNAKKLHCAADNYEIFAKIYYDYNASVSGGALIGEVDDFTEVFGDLLINGNGTEPNSYSLGSEVYSLTEEAISVSIVENGSVKSLDDLVPPKNARFVAAFDSNGELYALFSGRQSGYMKISEGKVKYMVRQDGVLTDYALYGGEIRLGTVYTPRFERTFTINDEDVYLPKTGTDFPEPISANKIYMSETDGYSYGVSAGYSTADGNMTDVCAIIGNPVAASADGRFVLNGKKGLIVDTGGEKPTARETPILTYATFGEGVCAIVEETAPESIKLLDSKLNDSSVLTGLTGGIGSMRFNGGSLNIIGAQGAFTVDCSDISSPSPTVLKRINGIITEQSAITCEVINSAVVISRYDLNNGTAKKIAEYKKDVSVKDIQDVSIGNPKTAVIDGEKSGVAFSYFDGVSVVSEYVVFESGKQPSVVTLYDDKTGFTEAYTNGGKIYAICSTGVKTLQ